MTRERAREVSVLEADLESEKEARRGWQDKAGTLREKLTGMVSSDSGVIRIASNCEGTSTVRTCVIGCGCRHLLGETREDFVDQVLDGEVFADTATSFMRSFSHVVCREAKLQLTSSWKRLESTCCLLVSPSRMQRPSLSW